MYATALIETDVLTADCPTPHQGGSSADNSPAHYTVAKHETLKGCKKARCRLTVSEFDGGYVSFVQTA